VAMFHHDGRNYEEAASAAAARARVKLEGMLDLGRGRLGTMIDRIQNEQPRDMVVSSKQLTFGTGQYEIEGDEPGIVSGLTIRVGMDHQAGLHSNALGQVAGRLGIPLKYINELENVSKPWSARLLAHNLNELNSHGSSERFLLREVNGEVRGFLSDRYRRMDSGPILESFAEACGRVNAVPVDSHASDTKWYLKMLLPQVYEPVPNEVCSFGVVLQNSDFGDGKLSVRVFMLRLWCTNYAIREEALSQVHLGRRLTQDIAWSDKTCELDTSAMASSVFDIVSQTLSPERVNRELGLVKLANDEGIDAGKSLTALERQKLISKAEGKEIAEIYNTPDVEILPPGNTVWRLSNALSALAGKRRDDGDERRARELEEHAGTVLTRLETKHNLARVRAQV